MSNRKTVVFVVYTAVYLSTDWMAPCIMYVGEQTQVWHKTQENWYEYK